VAWIVKRYIELAAGGTLWDPDPQVTQPGELAVDGAAVAIPFTTTIAGQAWCDVQVVDDAGVPQPPGNFVVTLGFVKRTSSLIAPSGGSEGRQQFAWNRGGMSADQAPGIEQTQANMEGPALLVFVVTAGVNTPASGRLAVRVWEGDR